MEALTKVMKSSMELVTFLRDSPSEAIHHQDTPNPGEDMGGNNRGVPLLEVSSKLWN